MTDRLRKEAEAVIAGNSVENESSALVHELQVHQIELEMQNEELRQTQAELSREHERYYQLFNDAPVGYITLDKAGIIQRSNQTFMQMVGVEKDPKTKALSSFLTDNSRSIFLGQFSAFFRHPEGKELEIMPRVSGLQENRDDTTPVTLKLSGRLLTLPGEDDLLFATLTDITEIRHATDKVASLLNEKELLLREVHHRIKNNLSILAAFVSLQSRSAESDEIKEILQKVYAKVQAISEMYTVLQGSGSYTAIDLGSFLYRLVRDTESTLFTDSSHSISVKPLPVTITVNQAVTAGLVINELVTNAVKHALVPGQPAEITVQMLNKPDGKICVQISNSIPEPPQPPSPEKKISSGDGTSLIKALAEQLDGEITFSRQEHSFQACLIFRPESPDEAF